MFVLNRILQKRRKHNEIGDQHLTEGAVYFRRSGIVLQDATGAALGTTIGAPLRLEPKVPPPPFHQVFMCCLSNGVWSADWSSVSSLRVVSAETRRGDPSQRGELPHEREKRWAEKVESREEQLRGEVLITLFLSPLLSYGVGPPES